MLLDPDLEKLAIHSRQRLVREFAEKHATLRTRSDRVPVSEARSIAEKFSCPLQIAIIAYLIDLDGIMSLREAIGRLADELQRRASVNEAIPNLPGNTMEFAIEEGGWIEYIEGDFAKELEMKVREISNLEQDINPDTLTVEKAMAIMNARTKVAETFIVPVLDAWSEEHPKASSEDVMMAFGPTVTGWGPNTIKGKLNRVKAKTQAMLRVLMNALQKAEDSATIDSLLARIQEIVKKLDLDYTRMGSLALAHLLLHIAPRPTGRGDRDGFHDYSGPSTRGFKAEPDLKSPFDFLERDIYLAKRRSGHDRKNYLTERIQRVIRVLEYDGTPIEDVIKNSFKEIEGRFNLHSENLQIHQEDAMEEIRTTGLEERTDKAVLLIYDFIEAKILGGCED